MRKLWMVMLLCGVVSGASAPAEEAKPGLAVELQIYDVADIIKQPTDFPASRLYPGNSDSSIVSPFVDITPAPSFQAADIVSLLHDRVFAAEFADPRTSIAESGGCLVVMQTPAIQKKVTSYISKLRGIMKPQVIIKGKLMSAADIPAGTIFDAAAFSKLNATVKPESILASTRLLSYNGQLVHTQSGRLYSYIRDYDVAGSVYDPVIGHGLEGYVFETRSTLSSDRNSADVNLRFTFTAPSGKPETRNIVLAPPVTSVTAAGEKAPDAAAAAQTVTLPIDVPSIDVQEISTTLRVPLGKWMLAGVMNNPVPNAAEKRVLLFISIELAGTNAPAAK